MLSARLVKLIQSAIPTIKESQELINDLNADAALSPAAHVANIVTADATDLASAEALANANKATTNAILAALQAAGLML